VNEPFPSISTAEDRNRVWRFVLDVEWQTRFPFFFGKDDGTGRIFLKLLLVTIASIALLATLFAAIFFFLFKAPADASEFAGKVVLSFFQTAQERPGDAFNIIPFLLGGALILSHLKKVAIVVDEQGIRFHGFLFFNIGKSYEWREFAQIRRSTLYHLDKGYDVLVFIDCYGRSFFIRVGAKRRRSDIFFAGDGHALSLPEIIERFYHVPITPLEEAEKKKIPALRQGFGWNINVSTGRAAHVVLAALGVVLLGFVLYPLHGSAFFLLESAPRRACRSGWARNGRKPSLSRKTTLAGKSGAPRATPSAFRSRATSRKSNASTRPARKKPLRSIASLASTSCRWANSNPCGVLRSWRAGQGNPGQAFPRPKQNPATRPRRQVKRNDGTWKTT
jgi:hypothetical protein